MTRQRTEAHGFPVALRAGHHVGRLPLAVAQALRDKHAIHIFAALRDVGLGHAAPVLINTNAGDWERPAISVGKSESPVCTFQGARTYYGLWPTLHRSAASCGSFCHRRGSSPIAVGPSPGCPADARLRLR